MVLFARDIVDRDFLAVNEDAACSDLIRLMVQRRHGFALVLGPGGSYEGIVTEWDILERLLAAGRDPASTKVGEIMTRGVISVDAGAEISEVADLMAKKGIRRILVVEGGKPVGFITSRTVLRNLKDYVDTISKEITKYGILHF